jgi:hypothetical protein
MRGADVSESTLFTAKQLKDFVPTDLHPTQSGSRHFQLISGPKNPGRSGHLLVVQTRTIKEITCPLANLDCFVPLV